MNTDRIKEWWRLWREEIAIGTIACVVICIIVGVGWYLFQTIPAPLAEGEVVNRSFVAAHWEEESRTRQVYTGQTCYGTGTSRHCTSNYRTEFYTVDVFYDDDWDLRIDGCSNNRRGDTICRQTWIDVSHPVYDDCETGEHWREETACRLL